MPDPEAKVTWAASVGGWLDALKSGPALIRDLLLIWLLLYCVFSPKAVAQYICDSGFTDVGLLGVSVKATCNVDKATANGNAAEKDKSPEERAVDKPPPSTVATFSQAQTAAPDVVPDQGWVFLGQASESKDDWLPGNPKTVERIPFPKGPGGAVRIIDDAYIREGGAPGHRSSGRIVSVARIGQRFKIVEVDLQSHALGGGFFVWGYLARVGDP